MSEIVNLTDEEMGDIICALRIAMKDTLRSYDHFPPDVSALLDRWERLEERFQYGAVSDVEITPWQPKP